MRPSPLFEKTAQWFHRANAALLGNLPCTQGCSGCCVGLFPVTVLDRQEIQRGLQTLPDEQRKRIERAAAEQVTTLREAVPHLSRNRFIDQWSEEDIDRVIERFDSWPCPALEEDGRCGLYEFRPLVCRSMGVPPDDGVCVSGACAVQTAVPLIRLSKTIREEETHLAGMEAKEIEALRHHEGAEGEELFLPYAFLPDAWARRDTDTASRALFMTVRGEIVKSPSETGAWSHEGPKRTGNSTLRPRGASPPAGMPFSRTPACRSGESMIAAERLMNNAR